MFQSFQSTYHYLHVTFPRKKPRSQLIRFSTEGVNFICVYMEIQKSLANDRIRSEISRKKKHIRSEDNCQISKHHKLLPNNYTLQEYGNQKEKWIFNFTRIKLACKLSFTKRIKYLLPVRAIQRCLKCEFDFENSDDANNFHRIKRIIKLLKYLSIANLPVQIMQSEFIKYLNLCVHYLTLAKDKFCIKYRVRDALLLSSKGYLLHSSSFSSFSAFATSSHIKNILKYVPGLHNLTKVTDAACLRLNNLTYLTVKFNNDGLNASFFDSLATVQTLEVLKLEPWDINTFMNFSGDFASVILRLPNLKELSVFFDFTEILSHYEWEVLLRNFQGQAITNYTNGFKLSFVMVSALNDSPNIEELFSPKLPENISKKGLSVRFYELDDIVFHSYYGYNFNFESGRFALDFLEVRANQRLPIHDEVLLCENEIKGIEIIENSVTEDYEPWIIKYIETQFPSLLRKIDQLKVPIEDFSLFKKSLAVEKIKSLGFLRNLDIIWSPSMESRWNSELNQVEKMLPPNFPLLEDIIRFIHGKQVLEALYLNFKAPHRLENLDKLFQELFGLPSFKKLKLMFYFGSVFTDEIAENLLRCFKLEESQGVSRVYTNFEKEQVPLPINQWGLYARIEHSQQLLRSYASLPVYLGEGGYNYWATIVFCKNNHKF